MNTETLTLVWVAAGILSLIVTLPGTAELLLLTVGGLLPRKPRRPTVRSGSPTASPAVFKMIAVVPAHDEEAGIGSCVRSLLACKREGCDFSVVVVADNCTDETAARAALAGARVLVRHDPARRGKGFALDYAFNVLLDEEFDAVVVVDADTTVEPNMVAEFRRLFADGADAVQCRYGVGNVGASLRTRLMNVALLAFNGLRPRGRERFGLSVGILGNGFALRRETLAAVPYDARSVVEDLEYHLRLVERGFRVRFADGTTVRAEMPSGGRGIATQRARWEGGRLLMLREFAPRLCLRVLRGRVRLFEPLLELLLLPLAFHALLLLVTLAQPVTWLRWYGGAALGLVLLHVLTAVRTGGGTLKDVAALAAAPFYVVWKLSRIGHSLKASRREVEWVRTEREQRRGERYERDYKS